MRPAPHPQQHPLGGLTGQHRRLGRAVVDHDAERSGRDLDLAGDPLTPVPHRHLLRPRVGGDGLEVGVLLERGPRVGQQDVSRLDAVEVGVAVGDDAGDGEPRIRRRGRGGVFLRLGIGRIGQGQQRGGAVAGRRLAHEVREHGGRGGIRDGDAGPGRVRPRRHQHLDGHARQSRRIHDDQPVDPLEMLLQRFEPLPRHRLGQRAGVAFGGLRIELGAEALRPSFLLLGPVAVLAGAGEPDPDGVAGVAQQAGPVIGILIDPADEGRTFGEGLLGGFERGGLACEGADTCSRTVAPARAPGGGARSPGA